MPQLRLLSSVVRTESPDRQLPFSVVGPGFSLRPRLDGGYTLSAGLTVVADAVPDVLRYLRHFLPVIRSREAYGARIRFGTRLFEEVGYGLRGVRELTRTRRLEPAPFQGHLKTMHEALSTAFPWLAPIRIAESWAGYFDVTPDTLPVISRVDTVPGLTVSTGYSGHGFGLGPGAGELTADIVLRRRPRIDPTPFRFDRFT